MKHHFCCDRQSEMRVPFLSFLRCRSHTSFYVKSPVNLYGEFSLRLHFYLPGRISMSGVLKTTLILIIHQQGLTGLRKVVMLTVMVSCSEQKHSHQQMEKVHRVRPRRNQVPASRGQPKVLQTAFFLTASMTQYLQTGTSQGHSPSLGIQSFIGGSSYRHVALKQLTIVTLSPAVYRSNHLYSVAQGLRQADKRHLL